MSKLVLYWNSIFKTTKLCSSVFWSLKLENSLLSNKLSSFVFYSKDKVICSWKDPNKILLSKLVI